MTYQIAYGCDTETIEDPEQLVLLTLSDDVMQVQYQKRAHNPLLIAAGFGTTDIPVPWLGHKRLRFVLG